MANSFLDFAYHILFMLQNFFKKALAQRRDPEPLESPLCPAGLDDEVVTARPGLLCFR